MNRPFFSIIITAYNMEKYVKKCILSVLGQSFDDFELIIIDDFSCDLTSGIINGFNDKRIKYHKMTQNKGVSYCRNKGLMGACGKYIFFLDADDWICPDTLKLAYEELQKTDPDVLFVPYFVFWENKNKYVYNNSKYKLKNLRENPSNANYEVCTKFYRLEFLRHNNIIFKETEFAEDFIFFWEVICLIKSFSSLKEQMYCYRRGHQNYGKKDIRPALTEAKKIVGGTAYEKVFYKKCADMLNFWLIKFNFDRDLYNFAVNFCPHQKILNIKSPLERLVYKIYFAVKK